MDQRRTAWDCMGCRCMRGDSGAGLSQGRQDRDPASSRRSCGCKVAGIALQLQYEHSSKPLTRPNCSRAQQQAAHTSGEARPPDLRSGKHKTGGGSDAGAQVVGNKKTEVQATEQLRVRQASCKICKAAHRALTCRSACTFLRLLVPRKEMTTCPQPMEGAGEGYSNALAWQPRMAALPDWRVQRRHSSYKLRAPPTVSSFHPTQHLVSSCFSQNTCAGKAGGRVGWGAGVSDPQMLRAGSASQLHSICTPANPALQLVSSVPHPPQSAPGRKGRGRWWG